VGHRALALRGLLVFALSIAQVLAIGVLYVELRGEADEGEAT